MKKILIFAGLVVLVICGVVLIIRNQPLPETSVAIGDSDWPQLQHDANRTGRSNFALIPPFTTKWRWMNGAKWNGGTIPQKMDIEIPVLSQPIAGDGKVYVGSYQNHIYAINESTGETSWKFTTNGPVLHTGGYKDQKVYFGSNDGFFYAINTTNGSLAWKYETGSIYSAPIILSNKVCIGSKTNYYYCFNPNDTNNDKIGDLIFKYNAEAPIYNSSAVNNDASKVYFMPESMIPTCLNLNTTNQNGERCSGWNAQPVLGQSAFHYWPVVVQDKIIFTYQPQDPTNAVFGAGETTLDSVSGTDWASVEPALINFYKNNPRYQTLIVLNNTTGAKSFDTASSHIGYHQDSFTPPTIGINNEIFTLYRGKISAFQGGSYGTKYPLDIGNLNYTTGKITSIGTQNKYSERMSLDMDDNVILSGAPGVIYGIHNRRCVIGVDLTKGTDFNAGQPSKNMGIGKCGGPGSESAYFFDLNGEPGGDSSFPDIGGYDNRGEGFMPPSINGSSMYMVFRGGMILAVNGTKR